MAVFHEQPQNPNSLISSRFKFVLNRAPNVTFWSQGAELPGISLSSVVQQSPFSPIPRPGGKLAWDEYPVTFKVDEDLRNYLEIFEWMVNLGFVDDMGGYQRIEKTGENIVSDATLSILTSKHNANVNVFFQDLYPVSLSKLQFDTKNTEIEYMDATVTFKYRRFKIEKLGLTS